VRYDSQAPASSANDNLSGQLGAPLNPPPKARRGGCAAGFTAVLYQPEHNASPELRITPVPDSEAAQLSSVACQGEWPARVTSCRALLWRDGRACSAGTVEVIVDWSTTPDVIAGRWISGASVLLLTGLWLLERRLRKARLS